MDPITLRLPTNTLEKIDQEAEQGNLSRAEYLREIVEHRHVDDEILDEYNENLTEYKEKLSDCEHELEEVQDELDRVHNEKRQLLELREEHTDLVRAVQSERSIQERRAKASLLTRWRWAITGVPDEE